METGYAQLTVRFEPPFWTLLYERSSEQGWEACQVTFGAEPRDGEVYAFLLEHWRRLSFSPSVTGTPRNARPITPKQARREARRATAPRAMGTKAQQALALQREQGREARQVRSRAGKDAEEARRFALKQKKRKEKHMGH